MLGLTSPGVRETWLIYYLLLRFIFAFLYSLYRFESNSPLRSYNRLCRLGFTRPRAYEVSRGRAIVESTYATTASGSLSGSTFPHVTASPGVAPESPPVSGLASVT